MQDFLQSFIDSIAGLFSAMFEGAPMVFGSKYPVFFIELLIVIVLFDLMIFGWRPLVRKYLPEHYSDVDHIFGQVLNVLALIGLVIFTFYAGSALGDTWGTFLGLSGVVWITVGILAVIVLGRFLLTGSVMGSVRKGGESKAE